MGKTKKSRSKDMSKVEPNKQKFDIWPDKSITDVVCGEVGILKEDGIRICENEVCPYGIARSKYGHLVCDLKDYEQAVKRRNPQWDSNLAYKSNPLYQRNIDPNSRPEEFKNSLDEVN